MVEQDDISYVFKLTNSNRASNVTIFYIVSGLLFFAAAFFFIATHQNLLILVDVLLAIVFFWFFNWTRPSFFEFLVTDEEIQVNYYVIVLAGRSFQSYQFNLKQLRGFEVRKAFGGLRSELIITVQTQYGLADFPAVSISLLNPKEIEQVASVLNSVINRNKIGGVSN